MGGRDREVCESCVESMIIEMVSAYSNRFYSSKPEIAARRIEAIGFQVGHQLSERYTMERPRFSDHLEAIKFICKDFWSELFKKQIDNLKTNHRVNLPKEMKWLLKESYTSHVLMCARCGMFMRWAHCVRCGPNRFCLKQGTFVLQDNRFRWLTRVSIEPSPANTDLSQDDSSPPPDDSKVAQATSMHLYFPCGIIRGALTNLGIPCAVSADMSNLPACELCRNSFAQPALIKSSLQWSNTVLSLSVMLPDGPQDSSNAGSVFQ